MPTVLQLRRGTTAQHASFTGAEGEVTVNTSKDTLVVHDGSTQGGFELALADLSNTTATTYADFSVTDSGGDGSLTYDNSTGTFTYTGPSAAEVQAHITAGTGVSISSGAVSIGQAVGTGDSVTFAGVTAPLTGNVTGNVTGDVTGNVTGNVDGIVGGTTPAAGTFTTVNTSGDLTVGGNQSITGNIVPSADVTYDLGSSTYQWRDIYVGPGSLYVNGQSVLSDNSGTITISADANQDVSVQTSGSGDIQLDPTGTGIIQVKSTLQIEDGSNITNSAGNPVSFSGGIKADTITTKTADTTLALSGNGTGTIALNDNTAITGTLSTTGSATIGGGLTVTGNLQVDGTTTTINSTSLSVDDLNITVASGAANAAAANGAGITVDGASATFNYVSTGDKWTMNKPLDMGANSVTSSGGFTGDLTGTASSAATLTGLTSTVTELNYVDGVTSAIQTQLDAKLASSSYTAADVLTKIKTVDGAGSGLDADLLDGQSSAYYRINVYNSSGTLLN